MPSSTCPLHIDFWCTHHKLTAAPAPASPPQLERDPESWHRIGRASPHMQDPVVPSAMRDSSVSPKPHSSTIAMEAREGRSGNAFACERCKKPPNQHAPFLTLTGRKHKVRCVPSDTASVCQRCVFPALFRTLGLTRASDARRHASSASST